MVGQKFHAKRPSKKLTREGEAVIAPGACDGKVRRADGVTDCILSGPHAWHQDQRALDALETARRETRSIRAAYRPRDDGDDPDRENRAQFLHYLWSGGYDPRWLQREKAKRLDVTGRVVGEVHDSVLIEADA